MGSCIVGFGVWQRIGGVWVTHGGPCLCQTALSDLRLRAGEHEQVGAVDRSEGGGGLKGGLTSGCNSGYWRPASGFRGRAGGCKQGRP